MKVHSFDPICAGCEEKLLTAHPVLGEWFREIKGRYPHLHISWAWRGPTEQELFFKEGKSRNHFPDSKHNATDNLKPCSRALDLFVIDEEGCIQYPVILFAKLNSENTQNKCPIEWAGTWKTFKETCHFQLAD